MARSTLLNQFLRWGTWIGPLALIFAVFAPSVRAGNRAQTWTLFIAGDFNGNLAPCGCSSPMLGGIQRMGSALDTVTVEHRIFLVNGGLLPPTPAKTPAEYRQRTMKAQTLAEASASLGVTAINLGLEEASQRVVEPVSRLSGRKLTTASLSDPDLPSSVIKGPFAIVGMSAQFSALAAAAGKPEISWDQALEGAKLAGHGHRLILMLRGDLNQARTLAEQLPEAELIVYSAQGTPPAPERAGHTWLVSPGSEGRALLRIDDNGRSLAPQTPMTLSPDFKDQKAVASVYRNYLQRVDEANLLAFWPRTKTGAFVGTKSCISCHKEEGLTWLHSAHSHAYSDLLRQGHGRDPDCVSCHVTGLSSTAGFKSLAATPKLANVTCESCHGPGEAHAVQPKLVRLAKLDLQSCVSCHSADNSPRFDPQKYWAKIAHGRIGQR
jgi:mono/diheme cytochrome c family protein